MKKQKLLLTSMLMAFTLATSPVAFADGASGVDEYGISLDMPKNAEAAGCSQFAWDQNVAAYQTRVKDYKARSEKINKQIMDKTVNPALVALEKCGGDAMSIFNKMKNNYNDLLTKFKDIKSKGLGSFFDGIVDKAMNSLLNKVADTACQAMNRATNNFLQSSGISQLESEFSNFSKNPLGYAADRSGMNTGISDISSGINREFNNVTERAGQVGTDAGRKINPLKDR